MNKKFEGTGSTKNEAFQQINAQMIKTCKDEVIIFVDLRTFGNFEQGYKMVMDYKTK